MAEVNGSIIGHVRDADGSPLPGVVVTAAATGSAERVTVTDAEGRFEIRDLAPGSCSLTAELEGFMPSRQQVTAQPPAGHGRPR